MVLPFPFRSVPQQSRLNSLLPFAAPSACSSSATACSSPLAEPTSVRAAERQEEVQHSMQPLPVQQGLPASPGITIDSSEIDTPKREGAGTDRAGAYADVAQTHGNIASQHSLVPSAGSEVQCPGSMHSALFDSSPAQSAGPSVPTGILLQSLTNSLESGLASQLCAQPEAYSYSQSQLGDQHWSALFLQAYLQTEACNMQPDDNAALHLTPMEGASSTEQQPAEPSEHPLELAADAGSLQPHTSHACADGHESLGGDSWLAAFTEAHLQGPVSSMLHADSDQLSEGSAGNEETDPNPQSIASSDDQSVSDESDGDYAEEEEEEEFSDEELGVESDNDESDADSDDEQANAVQSQLSCNLKDRVQRLASYAVGWGYHAAGAAYGSLIGLKQGFTTMSG